MNEYEIIPSRSYSTNENSELLNMFREFKQAGMVPYEAAKLSYKHKRPDIRLINTYEGIALSFGIDIDLVEEYIIQFR